MKNKATNWERSERVLVFFRTHPFIASSAVANYVGYDPAALSRLINQTGRLVSIPAKHLGDFETVLYRYGLREEKSPR